MSYNYIYLLREPTILNLSQELIKKIYIEVFYKNLMDDVFIDYEKVLNHKYGKSKKYSLNIMSLINNFNDYLSNQNAGIKYLSEDRLKKLIHSFNVSINTEISLINQANELLNNTLINWYITNKPIFNYPINGKEYIDKDEKDMLNIISKSYIVNNI